MLKDPAFPFYAQDFIMGTIHMEFDDMGRYIKLLAYQWDKGNIPKKRLGLLVGFDWDNLSDDLKEKFTDEGDFIINDRLERERDKRASFKEKQAENGKKGGRPKKEKPEESQEKPNYKPKENPNHNPNESQKKPLEDENENENKNESENENKRQVSKKIEPKTGITLPWQSETFKAEWFAWKAYKQKQHGFKYKAPETEQQSLLKLRQLSLGDEATAIGIIRQSIAQGWKGFFELKTSSNDNTKHTNSNHSNNIRAMGQGLIAQEEFAQSHPY